MSFSFGAAPNTTAPTSAPSFGGFGTSFGNAATTTSAAPSTGFSLGSAFGAGAATSTNTSLSFGTPASSTTPFGTTNTGLSLGTPSFGLGTSTSTVPTLSGLPSFGAPASTSTSTTGFTLGAPTSTATSTPGFSLGFNTPQTSVSTGFGGLGGATSTPSLSFGLGTATTSLGFLSGTNKPTLSLGTPASSAAPTTTTSSTFIGLGGADVSLSSASGQAGTNAEQNADKAARENTLPPEFLQQIEEFKSHMKLQKSISTEFSRVSHKPLKAIEQQIDKIKEDLVTIRNRIQHQATLTDKLRRESTKTLQDAEMAQRTYDTPLTLQVENLAPDEYFANLACNIEQELHLFRTEIDDMERLLNQVLDPSNLNQNDVVLAVKRLHEIFVALASKLQTLHGNVEQHKDQYLSFRRRYNIKGDQDVFQHLSSLSSRGTKPNAPSVPPRESSGPPIFSMLGGSVHPLTMGPSSSSQLGGQSSSRSAFPSSLSFGVGQHSSVYGGNPSSFSSTADASESRPPFQLQQPPMGNKRGKH